MSMPVEPMINDDIQCLSTGDGEEQHVHVDHETEREDTQESYFVSQTEDTEENENFQDDEDTN